MSRSAASIQIQISAMEAVLPDLIKYASASDGPTSVARQKLSEHMAVLRDLYNQLDMGGVSAGVSAGAEFVRDN